MRAEGLANLIDASSELGQELQTAITQLAEYENFSQPRIPFALQERTEIIQDLLTQFELPRLKRSSIFLRRRDMPNDAEDINNKTMRDWMTVGEPYRAKLSSAIKTIDKADKQIDPLAQTTIDQFVRLFHI